MPTNPVQNIANPFSTFTPNLSLSDKSKALGYASAGPISTGAFTVSFGGNANGPGMASGGGMKWALIALAAWWVYRHRRG